MATHLPVEQPVQGPDTPGGQSGGITVTHVPTATSVNNGVNATVPASSTKYTVTKAGNTVLCFIAYDPASGEGVSTVSTATNGSFTKLDTVTIGGTTGYKLETWRMYNAAHAVTENVTIVNAKSPANMSKAVAVTVEIKSDFAAPLNISLTASDTDAYPVTAASADTAAANEVFVSALLTAGVPTADPIATDGDTTHIEHSPTGAQPISAGTSFTLYVYRQNFIAVGNYGFACSLPEAHDWAISTHSFK